VRCLRSQKSFTDWYFQKGKCLAMDIDVLVLQVQAWLQASTILPVTCLSERPFLLQILLQEASIRI
jgi:7,8-dihydro-6-hydroxymethylpterin-pyrophosphokinase